MKRKKLIFTSLSFVIAVILSISCFMISNLQTKNLTDVTYCDTIRTVSLDNQNIDYESFVNEFEDAKLEIEGSLTTFEGIKTFNLSDFDELDLVSETNTEELEMKVKYHYEYDNDAKIITLSATLVDEEGTEVIDTIFGTPFIDENGNLDAVFDCDGEYVLLSQLQNAGMIENCGWFSNICKKVSSAVQKVTNTTIGKVGAVLTVAVPVVIGVVAGVAAAPVLPVIAAGALIGAGIACGTAAISTYQQDGKVDWEAVGICTGIGTAVGALGSFLGYKAGQLIRSFFSKANPTNNVKSFDTYNQFKKEYGKAADYIKDGEWHHIVEQQTVEKGINSGASVYNSQNTVAISKNLHHEISKYYSSKYGAFSSFRQYVNTLSYEEQFAKGLEVLKLFAEKLGETIIWL